MSKGIFVTALGIRANNVAKRKWQRENQTNQGYELRYNN
jgi:hypothetical protein